MGQGILQMKRLSMSCDTGSERDMRSSELVERPGGLASGRGSEGRVNGVGWGERQSSDRCGPRRGWMQRAVVQGWSSVHRVMLVTLEVAGVLGSLKPGRGRLWHEVSRFVF